MRPASPAFPATLLSPLALLSALLLVPLTSAHAQNQIGAMVGANFSTLRGIDGLDGRTGLVGGLYNVRRLGSTFALHQELLLVSKGAKGTTSTADGLKLSYIEIPILLRLNLATDGMLTPHVYAGPYVGLKIDCTVSGSSGKCDDLPGISTRSVDIGGIAGGGVDMALGGLILTGGARYGFGISTVADFELGAVKESANNGAFTLYAGVGFRYGTRR